MGRGVRRPTCRGLLPGPQARTTLNSDFTYKSLFFFYFAALGVYLPFIPNYFQSIGLAPWQISLMIGMIAFFNIFIPPLWGYWSDKFRWDTRILKVACWGSFLVFSLLLAVNDFSGVLAVMVLFGLFRSPIIPLMNATSLAHVAEDRGVDFGKLRVWGSIGFLISTILVGYIWEAMGIRWILYSFLALAFLNALSATRVRPVLIAPTKIRLGDFAAILKIKDFRWMVLAGMPHWMCMMAYGTYFSIHLIDVGAAESQAGWIWSIGTGSEIAVLYWGGLLVRRFGARRLLGWAFAASVLRWTMLGATTNLWWISASQLLHAFTFGVFYLAAILRVEEIVPKQLRASGQALFSSLVMALGSFIGINGAGWFLGRFDTSSLFLTAAILNLICFLPLLKVGRTPAAPTIS